MVDNNKLLDFITHFLLILGVGVVLFPLYLTWVASTHSTAEISQSYPLPMSWGSHAWKNYSIALFGGTSDSGATIAATYPMLLNSLFSAIAIAVGKIAISLLSAFAIVFFRFPGRNLAFALIFITLMLPVEVRISPTYEVVAQLGMINSYAGLIIPLIASATATLLFRQFFLTLPKELSEAPKMDGASAWRFFTDIVLPLTKTPMVCLVCDSVYLWLESVLIALLVTTDESKYPIVLGIRRMIVGEAITDWGIVMAITICALIPPAIVVLTMQKTFIQGLVEHEK